MTIDYDLLWWRVRLKILSIPSGPAQSLEPSRASGYDTMEPRGDLPELDTLERRWSHALSKSAKREVIRDALELLGQMMYAPALEKRRGTQEWKEAVLSDPRPVAVVARDFKISRQTIYEMRKAA